jgi:diaminohydroxyphosphoribosylaminopyrimidine deaminase/5-amino-6-(5-phosphoribosylamino)uracil reductase
VSAPFRRKVLTGLPWVIAKWAQTIDGRIATRAGQSRWISGERSRRLVHRERGRVDAILTGIGTVLADDPQLTARTVRRRRVARRIVIDPRLRIPLAAQLVRTASQAPGTVVCLEPAARRESEKAARLRDAGVELLSLPGEGPDLPLPDALRELTRRHDLTSVLVESGATLLGRLFAADLVCEAAVFVAPLVLGDDEAIPAVRGLVAEQLTSGIALDLVAMHRRGPDVLLRYVVKNRIAE